MSLNKAIENGYNDWVDLLKHTNNMDLLKDPYNIWLEAFSTATLLERIGVTHVLRGMIAKAATLEEQNILEKAVQIIESKGSSK